jgi:arginyl-tRNA synthetase
MKTRILLMEAARIALKNVLVILGVSAPEKM